MKRKKGLFAVVAALALSSVMAVMAFTSGYVWNAQSLGVSATNNALVALTAGTGVGNGDLTASYEGVGNAKLRFDFGKGIGGRMFGLQPGSSYVWDDLFEITNNSVDAIDIRLSTDDQLAERATFTGYVGNTSAVVYSKGGSNWLTIPSGSTAKIKAELWLHGSTPLGTTGNSVVVNTRVHMNMNNN